MSCTLNHLIPPIAAWTGIPTGRVETVVAVARQHPAATLPAVDSSVADAVWRQRPSHDAKTVTLALQRLLAGLILLQRQGTVESDAIDPLIAALVPPVMAGQVPAEPAVVERVRAWVFGVTPPDDPLRAPLPVVWPDDPDARRRAVRPPRASPRGRTMR